MILNCIDPTYGKPFEPSFQHIQYQYSIHNPSLAMQSQSEPFQSSINAANATKTLIVADAIATVTESNDESTRPKPNCSVSTLKSKGINQ